EFPEEAPQRVKRLVFEITAMNATWARPRINEVLGELMPGYYISSLWKANGISAGALIKAILVDAGFPADAVTVSEGTPAISNTETATGQCWRIVEEVAEACGCIVTVGP